MPIAVQQTLDRGLNGSDGTGGIDIGFVVQMAVLAAVAIVVTGISSYLMTARLFTAAERGLATLRIKAFRHVHDLPLLTQNTERRGALVSRVTSDVDQVSQFLVFGGIVGIISVGQVLLATVVMLFYCWQLTHPGLGLLPAAVPVAALLPAQALRGLRRGAPPGRRRCSPRSPSRSWARSIVRTYAIEERTQDRIDEAIARSPGGQHPGAGADRVLVLARRHLGGPGQRRRARSSASGSASTAEITSGEVLAFAFLVTLFVGPVQMGTQVLTDAQNADRRLAPGDRHPRHPGRPRRPRPGRASPAARARSTSPSRTSPSATRAGRWCCATSPSTSPPAPGSPSSARPGSGKTTFAKLLTRLMDPTAGHGRCSTASTCAGSRSPRCDAAWCWCRRRASSSTPRCWPTSATAGLDATDDEVVAARRPSSASATGSTACRTGSTPGSASAASRCRPGSASSSRCSAPTSPTPTCWSSTRPPARSTRRWRCGSAARSSG